MNSLEAYTYQYNLGFFTKLAECGVCSEDAEKIYIQLNKDVENINNKIKKKADENPLYPTLLVHHLLKVSSYPELAEEVDYSLTKEAFDLSGIIDSAKSQVSNLAQKYPWLNDNKMAIGTGLMGAALGPMLFRNNPLLGALFTGGLGYAGGHYLPKIFNKYQNQQQPQATTPPVTPPAPAPAPTVPPAGYQVNQHRSGTSLVNSPQGLAINPASQTSQPTNVVKPPSPIKPPLFSNPNNPYQNS